LAIKKDIKDLKDAIREVTDGDDLKALAKTEDDLQTIRELKDELTRIEASAPGGSQTGIDAFFRAVGKGMLKAQEDLDEDSAKYLASQPLIPSVFRIPKANAEFSFSMSSVDSKRIGLVLFSSKEKQEETQKQKISFEVVSAPPPVEHSLGPAWLRRAVVVGVFERRKVERALMMVSKADPELARGSKAHATRFIDDWDRVIVLDDDTRWILVRPVVQEGVDDLDLLHLRVDEDGKPVYEEGVTRDVSKVGPRRPARMAGLGSFFRKIAEGQKRWLEAGALSPRGEITE